MQSFNIIDMFNPEAAKFTGIFDCWQESDRLTVKDVIQENRIRLTSDLFNSTAILSEKDKEKLNVLDLCKRRILFFVRNMDTGEVVLFGRKFMGKKC
jgi:hypothetical protein